jgi:hypothetical protein
MPNSTVVIYKSQYHGTNLLLEGASQVTEKPNYRVQADQFDAVMRKLISTPASAKEGIKPTKARKKIVGRSKDRRRS